MAETWMCENGYHGTAERRWFSEVGWEGMYEGTCAGTVRSVVTGEEWECGCGCHKTEVVDDRPATD